MNTQMTTQMSSHLSTHTSTFAPAKPARMVKRKTRITIYLDDEVLHEFRIQAEQSGKGYQTLINAALRTGLTAVQEHAALAE